MIGREPLSPCTSFTWQLRPRRWCNGVGASCELCSGCLLVHLHRGKPGLSVRACGSSDRWPRDGLCAVQKLTADKAELAEQQAEVARREREVEASLQAATAARSQLEGQQATQRSLEAQLQVRPASRPCSATRPRPCAESVAAP